MKQRQEGQYRGGLRQWTLMRHTGALFFPTALATGAHPVGMVEPALGSLLMSSASLSDGSPAGLAGALIRAVAISMVAMATKEEHLATGR